MKVPGEDTTAPNDVDQILGDAFRQWWKPVTRFICTRVDNRHRMHAEDLASRTFEEYWRFLESGKRPQGPVWGLLCTMARQAISEFYQAFSNRLESSCDFTDPANRSIAAGHAYAPASPTLAELSAELDAATAEMETTSALWRKLHAECTKVYSRLQQSQTARTTDRLTAALRQADQDAAAQLVVFRAACHRVGTLRAEIEAAAGPHYRSVVVQPEVPNQRSRPHTVVSDPTLTHCRTGHRMTLHNTQFHADGTRACRACKHAQHRQREAASDTPKNAPTALKCTPALIARARRLFAAPAAANRTLADLGQELGVSVRVLRKHIPDLTELRHQARTAALAGTAR